MPFVKTAYLSDQGTARESGSSGENINHVAAVRMRVTGTGNLLMELFPLDDTYSQVLNPFVLSEATNIQPTMLANFIEQRYALKISTDVIDEFFKINRIIFFVKEQWSEYPG